MICALALLTALTPSAALADQDWLPAPALIEPREGTAPDLPPSVTAGSAGIGKWSCTFRFKDPQAQRVHLAGTFNNWDRQATPMNGPDPEGWWGGHVVLANGVHQYKFIVDGQRWLADPQNPIGLDDGHQGKNSVLKLGRIYTFTKSPAAVGDGLIEGLALEHLPESLFYAQRTSSDMSLLRYRTLANDVESVQVATSLGIMTPMKIALRGPVFAIYEAHVATPLPRTDQTLTYTFVLQDGTKRVSHFTTFEAPPVNVDRFVTPEWARQAIWYQIMVDRFRNGESANDPPNTHPWRSEWFTPAPWEGKDGRSFYSGYIYERMYGGDFQGVERQLGYLKELGITAIYFNPVFQAESHHKYNATSYIHIDDRYGVKGAYEKVAPHEDLADPKTWQWSESDKIFLAFLKKAKSMGFRVVLDGVFNHVGIDFPAFLDVKAKGQTSKYAEWFDVTSWEPFKYNGWAGHDALPAFKKNENGFHSPQVTEHIFNVTRRWMDPNGDGDPSDGIDGWRLDVPMDVPMPFWYEWRKLVKSINPDAYIVGEVWDRAESWLDGRSFDAVMNYQFAHAAVAWIFDQKKKINATAMDHRLAELRLAYPHAATVVLQNLLDSHDTDRAVSMALNPDRVYDRGNRVQEKDGEKYDNSKPPAWAYQKLRLAALLQMTYVGAPMIYYGDEVGMWGADDPTCRKPMLWEDLQPYERPEENLVMKDLLTYYKEVIKLRHDFAPLRTGDIQTLLTNDAADVWAFRRFDAQEELIVALNASDKQQTVKVALPDHRVNRDWQYVFGASGPPRVVEQELELSIPAHAGVVLHTKSAMK